MTNRYFEKYSKRINRMNFLLLFLSLIIIGNFISIQLFKHPEIENIIQKHGYKIIDSIGARGKIIDRNNNEMASSINKYTFWVNTNKNHDREKIIALFADVFDKPVEYYGNILDIKSNYNIIEKNITETRSSIILAEYKYIQGLEFIGKPGRLYKYNNIGSHIIGYINDNNHGIIGIEKSCNTILSGDTAKLNLKKGARGKYINIDLLSNIDINGYDIQLTIDIELQKILQEELYKATELMDANGANGIIINPHNGEILALASIPDFNPNQYYRYEQMHFNNSVISDEYEPGSTIKILPFALILQNKKLSIGDSIYCENGKFKLRNNKFLHDHEKHKYLTLKEILIYSSNIGVSKISNHYSDESLYKLLKKFGFGSKTYLPLNNESKGKIRLIKNWSQTSKNYISIGQEFSTNNLQLAFAYGVIANGGTLIQPTIVKKIFKNNKIKYENKVQEIRTVLSSDITKLLLSTLTDVVNSGTAKDINLKEYNIAGKTGTAQKFKDGNYSNYIATFASIFPSNNPKYVMVVSIDEPQYGKHWANLSAVPTSREIIKRMIILDKELHKNIKNNNIDDYILAENRNPYQTNLSNSKKKLLDVTVPDFIGKTLSESLSIAKMLGVQLVPQGISGKVIYQSLKPGTKIKKNVRCKIIMEI